MGTFPNRTKTVSAVLAAQLKLDFWLIDHKYIRKTNLTDLVQNNTTTQDDLSFNRSRLHESKNPLRLNAARASRPEYETVIKEPTARGVSLTVGGKRDA